MPGTYTLQRRARVRRTNRSELDERSMFTRAPLPVSRRSVSRSDYRGSILTCGSVKGFATTRFAENTSCI